MMEVKQNTAVDLNDLLTPSKSNGADEVDDAVMTDLTDRPHDLVNCELIKTNDKTPTVDDLSNGNVDMSSLINDVENDTDIGVPVNSELEDALLAEDDVLPKIDSKQIETVSAISEDYILADKVETSNSTTSSSNLRDPGDDLDTLLSKINDIVEDCIEKESDNNTDEKLLEPASTKTISACAEEDKNLNESILFVKEPIENTSIEIIKEKESEKNSLTADGEIETISSSKTDSEILANETEKDNHKTIIETSEEKASARYPSSEKENDSKPLGKVEVSTEVAISPEEKTEQPNLEIVQDNEISSNNNENNENNEEPKPASNDDVDIAVSLKSPIDSTLDKEVTSANDQDLVDDTKSKTTPENNKDASVEDTKLNEQNPNDDSDDEIVFYVDKPPESKENICKVEEKEIDIAHPTESSDEKQNDEIKMQVEETSIKKLSQEDDDVVLLLDDDEEEANQSGKTELIFKKDSSERQEESKIGKSDKIEDAEHNAVDSKEIEMDNSDNARDDFVCEKSNDGEKIKNKIELTETPEEANSNCSSSSNLLQEAKSIENTLDEQTPPEECENEEEDEEGEVEVIENELKETDSTNKIDDSELAPPAKRLRLSEDNVETLKPIESSDEPKESTTSTNDVEILDDAEVKKNTDTTISTLKRTHDVIEVETDEKSNDSKVSNDSTHKKPRTVVDIDSEIKTTETVEDEKPSEDLKSELDFNTDIKAVPSYEPIPLYPPPKFKTIKSETSLKLDFLKKYRKSFDNMTKQDLEELVLQKVVEAIIHRSEFSEMRELIEKQEKLITAHRSKISELSKQFRDLEMVHNRVVKDIEQRNSQFIMPVKITRAVGLQVYIPNKKSMPDTIPSASSSSTSSVPTSPQRPLANQVPSASSSSVNPPQRQFLPSQTETQQQRSATSLTNTSTNAGGIRRGCVQKITPTRPVPSTNQTPPPGSTVYRTAPNQSVPVQPRILNKNAAQTNTVSMQRSRYLPSSQDGQRLPPQQQITRSPNMPSSGQRPGPITAAQAKATPNTNAVTQRSPVTSSTSSIVDNYINTLTHLTGSNTAVSITPAKPKEKAVIDLTDEDEAPASNSSAQAATQIPVGNVQRRSLSGQNNTNSPLQYGRTTQSLTRIAPNNQIANNKSRQMSTIQAQKNNNSFNSISTPPGTSITRINVSSNAANVQRVKYSHPAPLPATPPQAFNPAWKLPPPRPTIRISNLDNGIVISWTMEESMDRHAECVSYQIYAYQETTGPPMVDSWRHVGDVKAMLLPMAVTLTQFQEGQRYFFAVRAVDCHQRFGPFSLPKTWS